MDAEHERVIGRLREIYRRNGKRFQLTVGTVVINITATERVKLEFEATEPVKVVNLCGPKESEE
jgi:hypothetical protein